MAWQALLAQGIQDTFNMGYGIFQGERNFDYMKKQYEYQKELNQKMMDREDNAIQRRAADMQQAGINPLLAAGQPAQAQHAVAAQAPQRSNFENMMAAQEMRVKTILAIAEAKNIEADTKVKEDMLPINKAIAEADKKLIENNVNMMEVENEKRKLQNTQLKQVLDTGEMELVSRYLAIVEREFKLNEDQRDAIIRRITFEKQNSGGLRGLMSDGMAWLSELLSHLGIGRSTSDFPIKDGQRYSPQTRY